MKLHWYVYVYVCPLASRETAATDFPLSQTCHHLHYILSNSKQCCDFRNHHSVVTFVGHCVLLVELYEFCETNWQWLCCCLWSVWPNFAHFWLHTESTDIHCNQIVLLFKKFSYSALVDIMAAILLWWLVGTFWCSFSGFVFQVGEFSILQAVSTPCCSLWLYV